MSIFTGSCDNLRCVTGTELPDFECGYLQKAAGNGEWGTLSTAVAFPTFEGQNYYILVQQAGESPGDAWVSLHIEHGVNRIHTESNELLQICFYC
jgi:hypothetical protein